MASEGTPNSHLDRIRAYLEAYNRAAFGELDGYVTADYVHHNNHQSLTLAQFKQGATWLRGVMPDFAIQVADIFGEGDSVAVRWVGRGTHSGSMFGETVTGRPIVLYGITVYRFRANRIAEDWEAMDEADLRRQAHATD